MKKLLFFSLLFTGLHCFGAISHEEGTKLLQELNKNLEENRARIENSLIPLRLFVAAENNRALQQEIITTFHMTITDPQTIKTRLATEHSEEYPLDVRILYQTRDIDLMNRLSIKAYSENNLPLAQLLANESKALCDSTKILYQRFVQNPQ